MTKISISALKVYYNQHRSKEKSSYQWNSDYNSILYRLSVTLGGQSAVADLLRDPNTAVSTIYTSIHGISYDYKAARINKTSIYWLYISNSSIRR